MNRIIDTTLRDGAQTPGLSFSLSEKLEICEGLSELGIKEIESGIPVMGLKECEELQIIEAQHYPFDQLLWCRCNKTDLEMAASIGAKGVHISIPCSDIHQKSLGISLNKHMADLPYLILFARRYFDRVSIGLQDASRTPLNRLIQIATQCEDLGIDRIRIADTVGIMTPLEVQNTLQTLKSHIKTEIEFHGHNDLGMATANSWIALEEGCSVSATLLGLGERTGNARVEELVMSLYSKGLDTSFKIEQLNPLCERTAEICRLPIPFNKPILGSGINTHESGIHCAAQVKNPLSYQALPAGHLSRENRIVFGTHSGKGALRSLASENKIKVSENKINSTLDHIKEYSKEFKCFLTADEVLKILKILILIFPIYLNACTNKTETDFSVFAASSLDPIFKDIQSHSINNSGGPSTPSFALNTASSGTLARQILNGAPADIFLSANKQWADTLMHLSEFNQSCVFKKNRLVLLKSTQSEIEEEIFSLDNPPYGLLAIGDPMHVPAGKYAQQVLTNLKWNSDSIKKIHALSVRQALFTLEQGEVDFAIVYQSDANKLKHSKPVLLFPENIHDPIEYFALIRNNSPSSAKIFWGNLCSNHYNSYFQKHGFPM